MSYRKIPIDVSMIRLMNKKEIEVPKEMGVKIEQAWIDGAKTVSFNNRTINTASIMEIEHTIAYREEYVDDTPEFEVVTEIPKLKSGTKPDNSGYQKFLEARKKLIEKLTS